MTAADRETDEEPSFLVADMSGSGLLGAWDATGCLYGEDEPTFERFVLLQRDDGTITGHGTEQQSRSAGERGGSALLNPFTITGVAVGAATGTRPQVRFVQTFNDGSQTTWQAWMVGEGRRGDQPDALLREMRGGRWWAGGEPLGKPIGEWRAARRGHLAAIRRRSSPR